VSFAIHVTPGNAPTRLYLTAGADDVPFPADNWLDFPVIVLTWWLTDYAAMRAHGSPVSSSFMNGPYVFEISPVDDGESLHVRFLRRTTDSTVDAAAPAGVRTEDYAAALLEAAESVAVETSPNDSDLPALRAAITAHAASQ
jgi:hypothetical protein